MGVNINYSLAPHVSTEMLAKTISRIIGSPLSYEGNGNILLDSSENNLWFAEPINNFAYFSEPNYFKRQVKIKNSQDKLELFFDKKPGELTLCDKIYFMTLYINILDKVKSHNILGDTSNDNFEHKGRGRFFHPNSTLFWACIMTRVTEMFGGCLIYSDAEDSNKSSNILKVVNSKALYQKPKATDSELSCKIKFSNALRKIPCVNDELIHFLTTYKKYDKNINDDRIGFLLKMGIIRLQEDLDEIIPKNNVNKIKVLKF